MSQLLLLRNRCKRAAAGALVLVAAGLVLAACGSSSTSSSTATGTAAATTAPAVGTVSPGGGSGSTGPAGAAGGGRFRALRECLAKNGITLPQRKLGQRPRSGGGLLGGGGGPSLPKGVTRAQYQAAIEKCGGAALSRPRANLKSPAVQQAIAKFATCMRAKGINVPAPNTSGKGPIFSTKGLNTTSPQFIAAEAACGAPLRGLLPRRGALGGAGAGTPGAPTAPGAPGRGY